MKLVDDAHNWWRWWSTWFNGAGLALQSLFLTWGTLPVDLWNMMPAELKAHIGPRWLFALPAMFFVIGFAAKFIKQPKLEKADAES